MNWDVVCSVEIFLIPAINKYGNDSTIDVTTFFIDQVAFVQYVGFVCF